MSEWPQYLLKHYILYHGKGKGKGYHSVESVSQEDNGTPENSRLCICKIWGVDRKDKHMLPAVKNSLHIVFPEENRREPE